MKQDSVVKVTYDGAVAVVTMDRAPVNAISNQMYEELRSTFHELDEDPKVRAIVFTGAGHVFNGGNELRDFVDLTFEEAEVFLAKVRITFNAIYDCGIPIIAAVNGGAVGGGLVLSSLADIRIASTKAFFALPEIDVGVLGGSRHAMRILSQGMTRWLMYTGRRIDAAEALRLNMVEQVVAPEELLSTAMAIAKEIARKSPAAIRLAKVGLNRSEGMSLKEGYEFECTLTAAVRRTPEAKEGALSFLEKRRPSYELGAE